MPKITGRIPLHGKVERVLTSEGGGSIEVTKFQATDRALGLAAGNGYEAPRQPYRILTWGPHVAPVAGSPKIDDNPYNFVPLGSGGPWLEQPEHPNHGTQADGQLTGWIDYTITPETPLFVPEGFPSKAESGNQTVRHFCRLHNEKDELRYAIPGSSLKGVVRSEVEAITNSLFGAADRKAHETRHLYRRRALRTAGIVENCETEPWPVRSVDVVYLDLRDWGTNGFPVGTPYKVVAKWNGEWTSKFRAVPCDYQPRNGEEFKEFDRDATAALFYRGSLFARPDGKEKRYAGLLIYDCDQVMQLSSRIRETSRYALDSRNSDR